MWHINKHSILLCQLVSQTNNLLCFSHWIHSNKVHTHTYFSKRCIFKKADLFNTSCFPRATTTTMQDFFIEQSNVLAFAKSQAESLCNRSPAVLPLLERNTDSVCPLCRLAMLLKTNYDPVFF